MPAGIGPLSVVEDEDFSGSSRTQRSFSVGLGFVEGLAVENRDIAESLYFRAGKFETDELSAGCVEFNGFPKYVCMVLPMLFARADGDRTGWHQLRQRFRISSKPVAPDSLAHGKKICLFFRAGCQG